ncbi:unnamed protein product, partial [Closterium sp. NIES-65]
WLAKVGRIDEAERQLKRLLGPSQAAAAAAELSSSSPQPVASAKGAAGAAVDGLAEAEAGVARKRADEAPAASFFTLFSNRYRKVVLLGMALFAVQQFAGINAIIYYSSSVFRSAGVQSDVAASALVGLANVLGTAVSLNLVDRQGRKSLLMGSFTGMGCSMLLLALTLSFPPLQPVAAPLSVLGTVAYVLSFAMGAGPVPALLLPEIFPSNIRASAVAAALTTHWLCNFVIGLSFLGFVKVVGVAAAYVGFAAVCFVGVVFVRACVVETKGRSLEEIERELLVHLLAPLNSAPLYAPTRALPVPLSRALLLLFAAVSPLRATLHSSPPLPHPFLASATGQQQRRGLVAGPSKINLAAAPSAVARAAEPSNFNVLEGAAESSGRVFITAYDDKGFTVGGRDLDSSILCVGDVALCWSPSCLADVTPDSLALFQLIRPQPELLLLGTGQRMQAVPGELREFVRACGMKLEVLSTRHAISTLNVLNEEGRSVAAALLLPSA